MSREGKNEPQPIVEYYDLNGTQYIFFSERMTWDEARVLCNYYNGKLAILDTMEKAMSIAEKIADSNIGNLMDYSPIKKNSHYPFYNKWTFLISLRARISSLSINLYRD